LDAIYAIALVMKETVLTIFTLAQEMVAGIDFMTIIRSSPNILFSFLSDDCPMIVFARLLACVILSLTNQF
jgi:hypothetical protein